MSASNNRKRKSPLLPEPITITFGANESQARMGGSAIIPIMDERNRQIGVKGYDADHDDKRGVKALVKDATNRLKERGDTREGLVAATSMLVAAIEAYDRANPVSETEES